MSHLDTAAPAVNNLKDLVNSPVRPPRHCSSTEFASLLRHKSSGNADMYNVLNIVKNWIAPAPEDIDAKRPKGKHHHAAATSVSASPEVPMDAPECDRFPGSGRLQEWARELRLACNTTEKDNDPWELTGRAVIIVSDDEDACLNVLRRVDPTMEAHGLAFIERLGRENCAESITQSPGKIGMLYSSEYETERRRALMMLCLRRLIAREQRPIEFLDVVNMSQRGYAETDHLPAEPEVSRRHTAYHEAGHATMTIIDSNGENVLEFSSIVPSANFSGVVVESYNYRLKARSDTTYATMLTANRTLLDAIAERLLADAMVDQGTLVELMRTARV